MIKPVTSFFTLALILGTVSPVGAQEQQDRQREIQPIAGDLYRVQNLPHYTVFLVTPEGIILADPINTEHATWLKGELAERFDVPVRYVIYSHHHFDHASGGEVFADTATFVGQENMLPNLAAVADDEQYADVHPPSMTYSERMTVTLGGKTVQLIHAADSHSDDGTIFIFPEERTAHAVDWINVQRLPFTRFGSPAYEWVESLKQLESLDFDIVAPGHGATGTKEDVSAYRGYIEELLAAVSAGIDAGQSLEEMQQGITLEAYSDWELYDMMREDNIRAFYEYLQDRRD